MARRELLITVTMATLLLVPVRIWLSGDAESTTHPRLVMDRIKTSDLPASSATPQDTRSKHHKALPEEYSGEENTQHFTQTRRDLKAEFERRQSVLSEGCERHGAVAALPHLEWRSIVRTVFPGPLSFCFIKKVASSALLRVAMQVEGQIPVTPRPLEATVVRHPLARLASAYRDKFLNGNPLYRYNYEWRNITQSKELWDTRFVLYWLPALVSEGFVEQTPEFDELLRKIRKAYGVYMSHYVGQTGALLALPSEVEERLYGAQVMEVAYNMLYIGPHIALVKALMNSYKVRNLMERFMNVSFTFNHFLHHVVWTHDQGMPDLHWITYTENCDPCRRKIDYILKLETIQEEVSYLFNEVLGYPEKVIFPVQHRSYGHSLSHSDRRYYANVSRELMARVLDIYKYDFALFGYSYDL